MFKFNEVLETIVHAEDQTTESRRYTVTAARLASGDGYQYDTAADGINLYEIDLEPQFEDEDGTSITGLALAIQNDGKIEIQQGLDPAAEDAVNEGTSAYRMQKAEIVGKTLVTTSLY